MTTSNQDKKGGSKGEDTVATDPKIKQSAGQAIDVVVKPAPPKPERRTPLFVYDSGRPMKFQSLEQLQSMIIKYFEDAAPHWAETTVYIDKKDKNGKPVIKNGVLQQDEVKKKILTQQKPLTVTGLAVALGTTRETLLDYEKTYAEKYPEFSDAIKTAKEQIKEYAESSLFGSNATGPIFNLKNNWGFKDKYETENTTREVKFVNTVPRPPQE